MCVRGHAPPKPVCVRDDCFHFFQSILRSVRIVALREHAAGGADLDHVGSIFDDFPHFVLHGFHAVRYPFTKEMKRGWQQVLIAVPAGDAQRRAGGDHARPDHVAIIDGIAQRNVRIVFRAHIAHGGKTSFERSQRVSRAVQRFARRRNLQAFIRERTQFKGQMRVHVDQAGQQRGIRQIDRRVSRCRLYFSGRRDLRNLFAFDHDRLIPAQLSGAHIEHAPRADHRPLRSWRLRACGECYSGKNRHNGREVRAPSANSSTRSCVRP